MIGNTFVTEKSKWEHALLRRPTDQSGCSDAPWQRLFTYKVSICRDERQGSEPDLLGVSRHQLPIVVELQSPTSTESPLQMLVAATACGMALRQAWAKQVRSDWAGVVTEDASRLPDRLERCELVCAAPATYWERWIGESPLAQTVGSPGWVMIADLRRALQRNGFPSVFLRLEHQGVDWKGRPTHITIVEQRLPE